MGPQIQSCRPHMVPDFDSVNRPLAHHGNTANLEDKTKFSLLGIEIYSHVKKSCCSVLQIGCIPTDVQGVQGPISELPFASVSK